MMRAFLARLSGVDRVYAQDHSYARAGTFPASEVLLNSSFENGVTSWTDGSEMAGAVQDRTYRATRTAVTITQPIIDQQRSVTQYVPYVVRCFASGGRYPVALRVTLRDQAGTGVLAASTSSSAFGMFMAAGVPYDAAAELQFEDTAFAGLSAGDFIDIAYASMSRCLLVDVGQNLLLQSDEFDTTWTTTNATVDDQSAATLAPDGNSTADAVEENTTNGLHAVNQAVTVAAAAADFCIGVAVKAGTRGFVLLRLSVADNLDVYFDIANSTFNAPTVGASWANARTFTVNLGNGWRVAYLVGRKTSAATALTVTVGAASASGNGSYAGVNGDDAIYLWRATLAQSSVPTRLVQTTTAATNGVSPSGRTLHVKGGRGPLEAALAGALLTDDQAELVTSRGPQLATCAGPLDLDAAGLGTIPLAQPIRGAIAADAPVILHNPMSRWCPVNPQTGWRNRAGGYIEPEPLELLEDIAPAA